MIGQGTQCSLLAVGLAGALALTDVVVSYVGANGNVAMRNILFLHDSSLCVYVIVLSSTILTGENSCYELAKLLFCLKILNENSEYCVVIRQHCLLDAANKTL